MNKKYRVEEVRQRRAKVNGTNHLCNPQLYFLFPLRSPNDPNIVPAPPVPNGTLSAVGAGHPQLVSPIDSRTVIALIDPLTIYLFVRKCTSQTYSTIKRNKQYQPITWLQPFICFYFFIYFFLLIKVLFSSLTPPPKKKYFKKIVSSAKVFWSEIR